MMRTFGLVLRGLVVCLNGTITAAANDTGAVQVLVLTHSSERLADATIELFEKGTQRKQDISFINTVALGVPYGEYLLRLRRPGFRSFEQLLKVYQPQVSLRSATVQVSGSVGGNVTLSGTGGPLGSTVLFNGASSASVAMGGSATMTVATATNVALGTYTVRISGMSGTVPRYSAVALTVAQAAPATLLGPIPGTRVPGGATTFSWTAGNGAWGGARR